ncbi:MAG: hypothetical protein NTV70_08815 [Acidobacteria bacterium]|nr:hypothetical protein [Acidobacteriota bacterium]
MMNDETAAEELTGGVREGEAVAIDRTPTLASPGEPEAAEIEARDAIRAELAEERRRREELEARLNGLVEETRQAQARAEVAERHAALRTEIQRCGVAKVDLAFRAIKDDIARGEDGRLVARTATGEMALGEYLKRFVEENPELLPARMTGGSGASPAGRTVAGSSRVDLDRIKPGMSAEELERVRQEIARVAAQSLRGL